MQYLHLKKLIYQDLNQSNFLIHSDSTTKLYDFGLARISSEVNVGEQVMTKYVSTWWYRAPELIICFNHYNESVDLCTIECIVADFSQTTHDFFVHSQSISLTCNWTVQQIVIIPKMTENSNEGIRFNFLFMSKWNKNMIGSLGEAEFYSNCWLTYPHSTSRKNQIGEI
jgi:serine/threonine protein kinase